VCVCMCVSVCGCECGCVHGLDTHMWGMGGNRLP
jgi:hypothetical protein